MGNATTLFGAIPEFEIKINCVCCESKIEEEEEDKPECVPREGELKEEEKLDCDIAPRRRWMVG